MRSVSTVLPMTESLLLERTDSVLEIWFNQPKTHNALTAQVTAELAAVLDAVRDDRTIRTIVLRGKGGTFCAGGDIKGFKRGMCGKRTKAEIAQGNRSFGELMEKVNEQPQVVIVLVEGAAIGGGMGLACVADITITTKEARFRLSETTIGIPGAQIAPFIIQRVGLAQARRLLLTAAILNGEEAVTLGIAHFVVKDSAALELQYQQVLQQIAQCAPNANATTKSILFEATRLSQSDALDFAAAQYASSILGNEIREGVTALFDKRQPSWASKSEEISDNGS